jgi:hypothetical protein
MNAEAAMVWRRWGNRQRSEDGSTMLARTFARPFPGGNGKRSVPLMQRFSLKRGMFLRLHRHAITSLGFLFELHVNPDQVSGGRPRVQGHGWRRLRNEKSYCEANQEIRAFQEDREDSSLYGAAFSDWRRICSQSAGVDIWFDQRCTSVFLKINIALVIYCSNGLFGRIILSAISVSFSVNLDNNDRFGIVDSQIESPETKISVEFFKILDFPEKSTEKVSRFHPPADSTDCSIASHYLTNRLIWSNRPPRVKRFPV